MTAEGARAAAGASNRVDLVNEDDRRRHFARFREQLTHAAGTDTDNHLDELRRARAEERHLGLACGCAGEQRLTCAGRTGQQHAFRRASAEPLVLAGVAKKIDDLVDLGLDLIDPGHIVERDANSLRIDAPLLSAPKKTAHRRLLTPEHERVKSHNQQNRRHRNQQVRQEPAMLDDWRRSDGRCSLRELRQQVIVRKRRPLRRELLVGAIGLVRERRRLLQGALDRVPLRKDLGDVLGCNLGLELCVRDGLWSAEPILECELPKRTP